MAPLVRTFDTGDAIELPNKYKNKKGDAIEHYFIFVARN